MLRLQIVDSPFCSETRAIPGFQSRRPSVNRTAVEAGIAFKKALIEASLNAELSHHLGYAPGSDKPDQGTNHRNASTSKTVLTGDGKVRIETPRDREGSFEPLLVPKHARRFTAFDDSIVALYARGSDGA
jgi:putative transposase